MTAPHQPVEISDTMRSSALTARSFFSILRRDIAVTGKEAVPFLSQVLIQPFFMLFIFGVVLGGIGYVDTNQFAPVLLPGVVSLNAFLISLQNTAMPLVMEFSWSKEIEDRLLAPLPVGWVAIEKMVFGALRGIVAALLMVPIGFVMLENINWPVAGWLPGFGIIVLIALCGSAIGMTIGTLVPSRHISTMFALVLAPVMFTGSTQFPWQALSGIPWFQVLCGANPLTYGSEAMRAILAPASIPSIPLWIDVPVMLLGIAVFAFAGVRGFVKRSIS